MCVRVLSFIIIAGLAVGAYAEAPKSLFGIPMVWRQANPHAEVRLNTLISVPWQKGKSFVLIRVPRASLSEAFVRGVFEAAKDSSQGLAHPLLLPGIELVLKPTSLDEVLWAPSNLSEETRLSLLIRAPSRSCSMTYMSLGTVIQYLLATTGIVRRTDRWSINRRGIANVAFPIGIHHEWTARSAKNCGRH
jgi:hypothetical protein